MDMLIAHATKLRAQSNKHKEKMASGGQNSGQADARDSNDDEPAANGNTEKRYFLADAGGSRARADEHLFEYQKHLRRNIGQLVSLSSKPPDCSCDGIFCVWRLKTPVASDHKSFCRHQKRRRKVFRSLHRKYC